MAIFVRNWKQTSKGEHKQSEQKEISHTQQHEVQSIPGIPPEVFKQLTDSGITSAEMEQHKGIIQDVLQANQSGNKQPINQIQTKQYMLPKYQQSSGSDIIRIREIVTKTDPNDLYDDFKLIGEGGMGSVFTVKRKSDHSVIVLKKLKYHSIDKAQLVNEITLVKKYRHQNIVQFIDCYLHSGIVWIGMEYMNGGTLKDLLVYQKEYPLSEQVISYIIHEIANAVFYLHSYNCLHRDIKSDNIFLTQDGTIKLGDFGLAVQLQSSNATRSDKVGTVFWMAPEVIRSNPYSTKIDIWSLGVVMIEMIEGYPFYYSMNDLVASIIIATKGAPPLQHPEKYSPCFVQLIENCLEYDPEKRWNASEIVNHEFIQCDNCDEKKNCFIQYMKCIHDIMTK